jgi:hypothetical protein
VCRKDLEDQRMCTGMVVRGLILGSISGAQNEEVELHIPTLPVHLASEALASTSLLQLCHMTSHTCTTHTPGPS